MKNIYITFIALNFMSIITNAQYKITIEGADTICIGSESTYSVNVSTFENHYFYRDSIQSIGEGSGSFALDLGYPNEILENTFSYDLWVKPTRTINMKSESDVCAGGVSVPLANSNQNWAIVPVGLDGGEMSVGLTIGTNGLMVGEHSGNILVSRLSYTVPITDWVHVGIVYRTDSVFLYLDGNLVRSRETHCTTNTKRVTAGLTGFYYSPDFKGNIDEFRLWDIPLTNTEIQKIKDKKLLNQIDGLRYYASFDDGKFERTLGDIGTDEMSVRGEIDFNNIKKSDWDFSSYTGQSIESLLPFDEDSFEFLWSTGSTSQNTLYTPTDRINTLHVEVYNPSISKTDSIVIAGIDCIYFDSESTFVGRTIEIPILTSKLSAEDNIISYQFDFNYDNTELEYVDYSLLGTLAEDGNIQINPTDNNLSIAWANDNPIIGAGEILKLRFNVIDGGEITSTITDALYNTTAVSIENGTITSVYKYGDIDANGHVQAYDAALALQYSVGLDPIPDIAPLPWENWRILTADVDGDEIVSANDAAEILKYSVGLIDIFPVEDHTKSVKSMMADVIVTYENDELIFTSTGELFGLNVFVQEDYDILGEPVFVNSGMLKATNISEDNYAIGLATAHSPTDDEVFMTIPVSADENISITLKMFANTESKSITVDIVSTSLETITDEQVMIYPNPANNDLFVTGVNVNSIISIYDLSGKQILSITATSTTQKIDLSALEGGIYIIKVKDQNSQRVSRFLKQ